MTTTTSSDTITTFHLRAPLLDQGRTMDVLAKTDVLAAHIKLYAEGGENALHAHAEEDHLFVILAGQATFRLGKDEEIRTLGPLDGVMIPRGNFYWFVCSGDENLVMLRVGAKAKGWNDFDDRINPQGQPFAGDSPENKEKPVIIRPDAFFG